MRWNAGRLGPNSSPNTGGIWGLAEHYQQIRTGGWYPPKATGGTIALANGYWVHTFTASGTFTPTESLTNVEYLIVAGGGGGSFSGDARAGSGAGGYRSSVVGEMSGGGAPAEARLTLSAGVAQTVTVGAGGSQSNGSNSVFGSITAIGGGDGSVNASGGSGAGGWYGNTTPGNGTTGQGFVGGAHGGQSGNSVSAGAGGGGAGQAGIACNSGNIGSNGGNGVASSITGISVTRAGGGGGAVDTNSTGDPGVGGAGGGGRGGNRRISVPPTYGEPSTGGGAGGSARNLTTAPGGSGVVIVRYLA